MPVKVTYDAVASHALSDLFVDSYLAYIAFRCELL